MTTIEPSYLAATNNHASSKIPLNDQFEEARRTARRLGDRIDSTIQALKDAYKSGDQGKINAAEISFRNAQKNSEGFMQVLRAWFETMMAAIRKLEVR